MSEPTGWVEDPSQLPHLLLSTALGTLRPTSITPARANDREVLVFAGTDEESLPVRFVDLDSGALLPDRSQDDTRVWDPTDGAEIAAPGFGGHALVAYEGRLLAVSGGEGTWQVRDVLTAATARSGRLAAD